MKNFKKILILLTWIFIIVYLFVSPFLISEKVDSILCNELIINIKNNYEGHSFITKDEIINILDKNKIVLIDKQIDKIQESDLEKILSNDPYISKADIYISVKGIIEIDIVQRIPLYRVINNRNQNFYIDHEGHFMPISKNYTAHVLTITGNYPKPISTINNDTTKQSSKESNILEMIKYIKNDDLWNAQIEQIHINKKDEIEIVPRVGGQRIIFGTPENYERKFKKLYALYEQGFNKYGWNNYKTINLTYKDQVVCTKL